MLHLARNQLSCRGARDDARLLSPLTPNIDSSSCTAGAFAIVRSIASEESVVALAAHVSFGQILKCF